jgi:tetratricopeptide (TPR) repeat protein
MTGKAFWTERRVRGAVLLGAALLAGVVYLNALANGYAVDDGAVVAQNPVVHGLGDLRAVLLGPYWPETRSLYRPVTLLTLALQWAVHGDSPAVFHAANLLLHACATALLAAMLLRLGADPLGAALGAAVFAVHPLHVEAVANVVGRAEILATLFYLAACCVYLGARRVSPARTAAIAGLMLLAMGSKEIAVTLPGALLVLDALRSRGERTGVVAIFRRNLGIVAVLVATVGAWLLLRRAVLGRVLGDSPAAFLADLGTVERWAMAVRLWPEYLRLFFWPADLSAEWGPATIEVPTWGDPRVWASLALMLALAAVAVRAWKRERWVSAAVLWLAVTVFPVSHFAFATGVMLAERTLYLPSAALALLAPPLVEAVRRRPREVRRVAAGVAVALLAVAAARTWVRTPVWRSSATVFGSLVEDHPEVWRVDWHIAEMLVQAGRGDEALPYFDQALAKTRHGNPRMVEQYTRWMLLAGQPARAEAALRQVPRHWGAAPVPGLYRARALFDLGRYREAIAVAGRVYRSPPGRAWEPEARHVKALAYDALGVRDSAEAEANAGLRDPAWSRGAAGWFHRARLRALAGDTAAAGAALARAHQRVAPGLRPALRLSPLPPVTHPALRGWVHWSPDGRVGGMREIARRARAGEQAVAAGGPGQ